MFFKDIYQTYIYETVHSFINDISSLRHIKYLLIKKMTERIHFNNIFMKKTEIINLLLKTCTN